MGTPKRNLSLTNLDTGGRGATEIKDWVDHLLHKYKIHTGSFSPSINPETLAKLQNAEVNYNKGSSKRVASLMPMGNGFIINVNKDLSKNRKRNAICHEIAHTFFYDTESTPPKRHKKHCFDTKEEENLCFWAAREMLVPSSLLEKELDNIGYEMIYSFDGIKKLAETFEVSSFIIASRISHDLALIGDEWIVLWFLENNDDRKLLPKSLYPKHISTLISHYIKSKIINEIRSSVFEHWGENSSIDKEFTVKKKKHRLLARTEEVNNYKNIYAKNLYAISWVSLIFESNS